jgi:glutamine amidotransferase
MSKIVVVDYGLGNLKSVSRAIEYCGGKPEISSDRKIIASAKKIILPGVGAFGEGMKRLKELEVDRAIKGAVENGSYLLGICLGMQMLLETSEEFGLQEGLGLIKGSVKKIQFLGDYGVPSRKVPHIGWSPIYCAPKRENWSDSILSNIPEGSTVYFVHSYMASPTNDDEVIASCNYEGLNISAVIGSGNILGMQFHPEKSGLIGLQILKNYLDC